MEKVILVLDGVNEGKTKFIEIIKRNKYWCWNVNPKNFLSMIAYKLGFNGERDKRFFDFISEFEEVANRYWNFEINYIQGLIQKFFDKDDPMVLIVHNCKPAISKLLQDKYENCFNILISDNDDENNNYCKVMNYLKEDFESHVITTMRILTKEIGE